ncbi:MAG: DNA mismatch repair protein MutS [Crocinitomicaceae bacterium]|nr:DNA mismatch repair protein MutS [Crocinitomicaceae bacterium]
MQKAPSFTDIQTLQELQFTDVLAHLSGFAISKSGIDKLHQLIPSNRYKSLIHQLTQTKERLDIILQKRTFPPLEFDELLTELKFLGIEDAVLSLEGFIRIHDASNLVNAYLKFFEHAASFSTLAQVFQDCYHTDELVERITKIIDVKQTKNIKDDATSELAKIRQEIKVIRQKINRNFEREMRKLVKDGLLGETYESFIDDRRVLTVQSGFKRRVPGTILGASKTGSLTYIEPKVNEALNHELSCLFDDEKREVYRILKALTAQFRIHLPLIQAYQTALVNFDVINAKARLAFHMEATLPALSKEKSMHWSCAYHPLLRQNNQAQGKPTIPQEFSLDQTHRMLVISGPNAGGKSLTMKTFGLLQCMLQAGLLIPVHSDSNACFFEQLYSDIGDNQSIENELSTYSYRLQRMKFFLEQSNPNTFLLLDEFGTGSDPELGGALAEIFFERLYDKGCFAIITTHYAAIKFKASELAQAVNGAMKFDLKSLKPLYQLELGMPGSSFTFEVASINGIPADLLKAAKQRLSLETKRFNELLSTLQQEKRYLQKMIQEHKNAQEAMAEELLKVREQADFYTRKTKVLGTQSDEQAKWIQLGQRMEKYLSRFNPSARKRKENEALMEEIRAFFLKSTVKPTVKKPNRVKKKPEQSPAPLVFKVGEKVRMAGSKQVAIIEAIEKSKAQLLVNNMKISVPLDKLLPF